MKKLMSLMLGMALAFTTVAVSFAQEHQEGRAQEEEGQEED